MIAHVVVTNTDTDTVLLGMSVIGRVGLVPNPYKGTLKYYVNWETRGSRSALLACTFPIEVGKRKMRMNGSPAFKVIEGWFALAMPKASLPTNDLEYHDSRLRYQTYGRQLLEEMVLHLSQRVSSLTQAEPDLPVIMRPKYCHLLPLNRDLVDIIEPAESQGLIVVELCGGILAAIEALVGMEVNIRQLHICEFDPLARLIAVERLEVLISMFPDLLPRQLLHRALPPCRTISARSPMHTYTS